MEGHCVISLAGITAALVRALKPIQRPPANMCALSTHTYSAYVDIVILILVLHLGKLFVQFVIPTRMVVCLPVNVQRRELLHE